MGSIRIRIDIAPDGTITGKAPPAAAGAHEVVVSERRAEPQPPKGPLVLPVHDCGPWPKGLSLRREDIYGDDWR
ncbi:MAG: hypothetical protein NBV67_16005 [Tagaea sp.]|nr:hypothetical protein [Tagaea sp.]